MKTIMHAFSFSILLLACTQTKNASRSTGIPTYTRIIIEDGSSFENAVVIHQRSAKKGIAKENQWLGIHYPGYKFNGQALVSHNGKSYDIIEIKTADGKEKSVYFNISKFYRK